ncbi:uncharacterized protein LOC108628767 isoform X2 [Ceratina calcarata]|uniref:Uncharacterized protein LOC108628767 isoform X2 n=1 Tax=Ceratina calcarata TaxID=156304 RepID=A0AAJ7NB07_9HYME|nr:uncharacterized protein LOC108628767 isoform X2 [Ceratina calcarata]
MSSSETTALTSDVDKPAPAYYVHDSVPFHSHRRSRRTRLRCLGYTLAVAIFTMALIVTVSYSVSHDIADLEPSLTNRNSTGTDVGAANLTMLRLGFAPGSGSYTSFSNGNGVVRAPGNTFPSSANAELTEDETEEALEAGRRAMDARVFADTAALISPLPPSSPELRHRYAVSTCVSVGALALAATAELAATKKIESARTALGEASAFGSFFDGGWGSLGVCKHRSAPECPTNKYRTFDGSCNRPMQLGAAMTPFRRSLPPDYADGVQVPRRSVLGVELPSAREISLKVHKPSPSSNPRFTVMLAVYGQFLDHDITATAISQGINGTSISCCPPSVGHPECFPVPISSGDPVFDVTGRTCMEFVRSAPAPQCMLGPRQQLNQVTAFIDGSTVYGSDAGTARDLREFVGGRLRMQLTPDGRSLLPPSKNPNDGCNRDVEKARGRYCFSAGDARANENLHLTTMHLLWARQHNRIVEQLAEINPFWDDQTLYEEARRVVGAQLQHITYREFLPVVLGDRETNLRDLRPLPTGYRQWIEDPKNDPSIANEFAAAAFRFAHTLLPGLMKMTDEQKGTTSYVELHRMLFNPYMLYGETGVRDSIASATGNTIQMTSAHVTSQLTNHLFEDPVGNVTIPCGLDLVSLNIQRGRDHGLPGYTKWREYCGLGKVETFSDLAGYLDPQTLQDISSLYSSVHDVDLYTGALAELPDASGGIVGPTFSCLIADQFVRLQKGDRFWYELSGQPHSFTEEQLVELRKSSLARLICDCSKGITQTQAEVMRTIGPDNPVMPCEDIPAPSFEPWKDDVVPKLRAPFAPVNWTAFKSNINETIKNIVDYINGTRSTATLDTDWLAFKDYINNTFSDLRNQLSGLHPPATPIEKTSMTYDKDSFILRATEPPAKTVYQDWLAFRSDLMKSLNDSIESILGGGSGGGPAATAGDWIAFKRDIVDRFADLKNQIASAKADVVPKLKAMKVDRMESMDATTPISAIFDWKNFKDNVISSLDDAISNIGGNMPPPGDPAWATFGDDIKDRFSAFRDKVNAERPTTEIPVEMAAGGNFADSQLSNLTSDWLNFRAQINEFLVKTVGDIEQKKPATTSIDPAAWYAFQYSTANDFAKLKDEIAKIRAEWLAKMGGTTTKPILRAAASKKAENSAKFDYSKYIPPIIPPDEWINFKKQINDTVTNILNRANATGKFDFDEARRTFNESFIDLSNELSSLRSLIASAYANKTAADWIGFRTQLNSTVQNMLDDLKNEDQVAAGNTLRILFRARDELVGLEQPADLDPAEWTPYAKRMNETISAALRAVKLSSAKRETLKMGVDEPASSSSRSYPEMFTVLPIVCLLAVAAHDAFANELASSIRLRPV